MIAVLAGSIIEFRHYHPEKEDDKYVEKFVYISSPYCVYGNRFKTFEVVGTFWERSDADKLFELVKRNLIQ